MTKKEFIELVAPYAVNAMKLYNYPASVLIAQAALETGYSQGYNCEVLVKWGNLLGMKADLLNDTWTSKWWDGRSATKQTPEHYATGWTTITDAFRVYSGGSDNGFQDCFNDYCQFMLDARYSKNGAYKYRDVLLMNDPAKVIQTVSMRGYATDPAYAPSVMRIIKEHNLTEYDKEAKKVSAPIIIANKNFGLHNTSQRTGAIKYLVIHYVGATGGAAANIEYYNRPSTTNASADFFIDFDGTAYGYNMDIRNRACWAIGGSKQSNYGGSLYKVATNQNSISIEMCVRNKGDKSSGSKDWYFENATIEGTARLAAHLLDQYCIPIDRMIRHYDVNGKFCPGVTGWIAPMGGEDRWNDFKERVKAIIGTKKHSVLKLGSNGEEVRQLQESMIRHGFCDCHDYKNVKGFCDGDFGGRTRAYVMMMQEALGLENDGIVGPKTWAEVDRLDALVASTDYRKAKVSDVLAAAKNRTTIYAREHYRYDNLPIAPQYSAILASACDRGICEWFFDVGYRDIGNRECSTLAAYFLSKGAKKITRLEGVRAGDIVFVNNGNHVFLCAGHNLRYDCGSIYRIQLTGDYSGYSSQPFNEPILNFAYAIRPLYAEENVAPTTKDKRELIRYGQEQAVKFTGVDMLIDGIRGEETNRQIRRCIQKAINLDYGLHIKEDGYFGNETRGALGKHFVKYGETQWLVTALQIAAYMKGLDPNGVEKPGHYGDGLAKALGTKYMDSAAILRMAD